MTVISSPVTVRPHDSLLHVLKLMEYQYVPKLVVTDEFNNPLGILTQKDILEKIDKIAGRSLSEIYVSELMRTDFLKVENGVDPIEAASLLLERNQPMIVVTSEEGKVIGVILKKDLVSYYASLIKGVHKASDFMSKPVETVIDEEPLSEAVKIMKSKSLGRLVVVSKSGKVVGMLSTNDALFVLPFLTNSKCLEVPVKDVMNPSLNIAILSEDLSSVAMMISVRVPRSAVFLENGKPIGIITSSDIVRALVDENTKKYLMEIKIYTSMF
jgi:predicted transcriptional regulator